MSDQTDDALDRERELREQEREARERDADERAPIERADTDATGDGDADQPAPPGQGPHRTG